MILGFALSPTLQRNMIHFEYSNANTIFEYCREKLSGFQDLGSRKYNPIIIEDVQVRGTGLSFYHGRGEPRCAQISFSISNTVFFKQNERKNESMNRELQDENVHNRISA